MTVKKELKIGLIALVCVALLFWGANFLKGTNLLKEDRSYYAIYSHIDGLSTSNPVNINGFKVGQVEEIRFMPDQSGNLIVRFTVTNRDFTIPKDTKAKIVSSDILGSKSINLVLGQSIIELQENDTLSSEIEATLTESVNQQIAPLKKKTEDLIQTVDSAILVVSSIFNKKARKELDASFSNIRSSLEAFERTMNQVEDMVVDERENLNAIFKNVESITRNLANNNEQLNSTLSNMEAITDSLAGANLKQTVNNASQAMVAVADVMRKINEGEGSMGQLVNNDSLYNNLENAALDLDKLLLDMRLNPERYVHFSIFGRKNKKVPTN
ncbi:MAG: ABC transporter permease [Verrucomicrobia bacterium]|nr:ABC transporter permease [Verrucomicrobiota bacterium]